MKEKRKLYKNKGITLIALVVTTIVLLILAGISIMMLTGQNGILNKAAEAKEKTTVAQLEEALKLVVTEYNLGGISNADMWEMIESALDKYLGTWEYGDYNEELNSQEIITADKTYLINDTFDVSIKEEEKEVTSLNGMYSVADLTEDDIAPADLFLYGDFDDTNMTVTIYGLDAKYCNGRSGMVSYDDSYASTNYDIKYNDETISDTLVIPYKYEKDGKEYTVTAACANANGDGSTDSNGVTLSGRMPNVKTIIYPNTVKELIKGRLWYPGGMSNDTLYNGPTKIVLPNELEKIGNYEFTGCLSLKEINLPKTLTSIGDMAFRDCTGITKITIPENVKSVGNDGFNNWTNSQTIIIKGATDGWDKRWNSECNANIKY